MKAALPLFLAVFIAGLGHAQQPADEGKNTLLFLPGSKAPVSSSTPVTGAGPRQDKPADAINVFFLALKAGQVDAAYDGLVHDTIIADRKQDVTALKERTKQAIDNYGPISGYEIIDDQSVGSVLFRRTCISFNSDLPLRWRFYFYKSGGSWRLVDLRVDDGLVELFDDSARARR